MTRQISEDRSGDLLRIQQEKRARTDPLMVCQMTAMMLRKSERAILAGAGGLGK